MNLDFKLLNHPFYQAWSHGAVSREQLARYAHSYGEFIALMPDYWTRIGQGFKADTSKIVAEETVHALLWEKWTALLAEPSSYPRMTEVLEAFTGLTTSELLGAVQSFEIQQPDVARTKKAGLMAHYGFVATDTVYFDEHLREQEHIDFGQRLAAAKANPIEFQSGFNRSAELVYRSLDMFIA